MKKGSVIMKRILACVLAAVILAGGTHAAARASAGAETQEDKRYVKEIRIARAATEEVARGMLVAAGFRPLSGNADLGAEDGAAVVGILLTGDASQALTDLAVLTESDALLVPAAEAAEEAAAEQTKALITLLGELRRNVKRRGNAAGKDRADLAVSLMNCLIDRDTHAEIGAGRKAGDLLLGQTRQEYTEEEWDLLRESERGRTADLERILTGCSAAVRDTLFLLASYGGDDGKIPWTERIASMQRAGGSDNTAPAGPPEEDLLYGLISDGALIREELRYAKAVRRAGAAPEGEEGKAADALILLGALEKMTFKGKWGDTLADFFDPSTGRRPPDAVHYAALAATLSEGRRAALSVLSLRDVLLSACGDGTGPVGSGAAAEIRKVLAGRGGIDLYAGIDQTVFRGGTALTEAAFRRQSRGVRDALEALGDRSGSAAAAGYAAALSHLVSAAVGAAGGSAETSLRRELVLAEEALFLADGPEADRIRYVTKGTGVEALSGGAYGKIWPLLDGAEAALPRIIVDAPAGGDGWQVYRPVEGAGDGAPALYAGRGGSAPILAETLVIQYGRNVMPSGCSDALHRFGTAAAFDNRPASEDEGRDGGIYLYWRGEDAKTTRHTASSFGAPGLVLAACIGLAAGVLGTVCVLRAEKKRKKEEPFDIRRR